ncbi:MAG TPA: threonine--tRNA ligase, partial [Patescibacteria group bacterium]
MDDKNNLEALRHSCAHLLAAAVMELWPNTKRTIGPAIENGFYYDFDFENPISEGDLTKIEKKMAELLPTWNGFEGREVSVDESLKIFKDNPYKIELINEIASSGQKITIFKSGKFEDLCRGGHVKNPSKEIGAFKLLSIAGAYWRGSEKNPMLTRIYGTCWPSKKELDEYLNNLEEAKKRDHRKLGAQLGLWVFSDYVGSGLPLFTQKGALIRRLINEFVEELQTAQEIYQVWTPQIAKAQLFKISGHYDKYRENMFHVRSNYSKEEFFLKPMNCPQHTQIYASQPRSYKDLPIRMSDFAMLYRDEKPGELSGLTRTRSFSQDDCHVFCREDQIIDEMNIALDMTQKIMASYGFSYKYRLSTRDPNNLDKYLGDNKHWEKAEKLAEKILKDKKIDYFIGSGEAAFYAPKLDLIAKDSLGREWQLSTLQIDFVMPERFKLSYVDQNGKLT